MKSADSPVDKRAADWMCFGQSREAQGAVEALAEAVQAYDSAIALLKAASLTGSNDVRHELGVAWMNRGNALQKQGTPAAVAEAVIAYDEAIALVRTLPIEANPVFRNCLGAAWLNRGHALLQLNDSASLVAAIQSHEAAATLLRALPLDHSSVYRLNRAGAEINLANTLLVVGGAVNLARARTAAKAAHALVLAHENTASEFADLGLKSRRALCEALGQLMADAGAGKTAIDALADEASEAVDSGLALARQWEQHGVSYFRPLALRLYRFGAQLYALHQPHFLAEFLLENLEPVSAPTAWSASGEFREIARTAVLRARQTRMLEPMLGADDAAIARLMETSRALTAAERRIAELENEFPANSPVPLPMISNSPTLSPLP
jgi:hypothetical protein